MLRELFLSPSCSPLAARDVTPGDGPTASPVDGVEESKGENPGDALIETKEENEDKVRASSCGRVEGKDKGGGCIGARFEVLQLLNRQLRDALPFFDLSQVCGIWVVRHFAIYAVVYGIP